MKFLKFTFVVLFIYISTAQAALFNENGALVAKGCLALDGYERELLYKLRELVRRK